MQNQLHDTMPDWCLSNLLLEEKPRNREPMVFPGNWFWFFIVFLLSDLVLLLLLVKLICSNLIPGGCREQCVISMPLATFFGFSSKFEAKLSWPLSSVFISDCIKDTLKLSFCLVWQYQLGHLFRMEKNLFTGNMPLFNLIAVRKLETTSCNHC